MATLVCEQTGTALGSIPGGPIASSRPRQEYCGFGLGVGPAKPGWQGGRGLPHRARMGGSKRPCMRIIASGADDLQDELGLESIDVPCGTDQAEIVFPSRPIPMAHVEAQIIHALRFASGDQSKVAQLLGMGKTTIYRKMKEFPPAPAGWSAPTPPASCQEIEHRWGRDRYVDL